MSEQLHETHVCRDCGAEITLPYNRNILAEPRKFLLFVEASEQVPALDVEQLRKALDDAIYDAAVLRTESVRLMASDARRIRAALAAAPSTPEPLTYVGGVPHNHSHDRNRECREVLVGACLVARLASKDRTPSAENEQAPKPVPRGLSRLTLDELRDRAEANGITWWDDQWTRRDFIEALAEKEQT